MKIKVCGMKVPGNIKGIAGLKPDYIGFIFYSKSPRYVGDLPAAEIAKLPASIIKTGVFVNEDIKTVKRLINQYQLAAVQLHGSESPGYCAELREKGTVLKAFGIDETFDFGVLADYADKVDYFLFDTKTAAHGGSGQVFDWRVLDQYQLDVPFFLSGGLSADNLTEVKQIKHPAFYGVDLNSRFEMEPGLKDENKLRAAFTLLRTN
ncbi:phosphoribosylanthranilate isomerase [Mucilaginibacter sp. HME9299]|uniref:N-(5'-phosphoribosyl)anthranilate isomerase n=2 Tax=Mucilaginibacter aquatilis TaxID=1517760 RepID=A0A6I4IF08_9SPHI|nr:phosphoribosylanthranilate isomerase [Mucilaginibacter aquatilis]